MSFWKQFWLTVAVGLAVVFLIDTARADSFQIHLVSEHASGCDRCNEENWGLGYIGGPGPFGVRPSFGYYTNSWFRDSFYAGGNLPLGRSYSVTAGFVSGYQGTSTKTSGELLPLVMGHANAGPALRRLGLWPLDRVDPVLTYAPTQDGGVILFSLSIETGG